MVFLPGTLSTSIKEDQAITAHPHNTNGHCRIRLYACLGRPFLKQLYACAYNYTVVKTSLMSNHPYFQTVQDIVINNLHIKGALSRYLSTL